jgi:hypothetical protein
MCAQPGSAVTDPGKGDPMTTLRFLERDRRQLLDILMQAVEIASVEGKPPEIEVDGTVYAWREILKVAALLPHDEPLQPHHQDAIDRLFKKRQLRYGWTAYNLAHRALAIAANNPKRLAAGHSANVQLSAARLEVSRFDRCGLSKRTIAAIVACGIDAPERLLFMTEAALKSIPGIGKASLSEIEDYRARYVWP